MLTFYKHETIFLYIYCIYRFMIAKELLLINLKTRMVSNWLSVNPLLMNPSSGESPFDILMFHLLSNLCQMITRGQCAQFDVSCNFWVNLKPCFNMIAFELLTIVPTVSKRCLYADSKWGHRMYCQCFASCWFCNVLSLNIRFYRDQYFYQWILNKLTKCWFKVIYNHKNLLFSLNSYKSIFL